LQLTLVAIFTEKIDGWAAPYMWAVLVVSLLATLLGIGARRWLRVAAGTSTLTT
jgi:hypothetical protein